MALIAVYDGTFVGTVDCWILPREDIHAPPTTGHKRARQSEPVTVNTTNATSATSQHSLRHGVELAGFAMQNILESMSSHLGPIGGAGLAHGRAEGVKVYLGNMFVLPEWRRRGIGRELMKGAEAYARKIGASEVCLEVHRQNFPAQQLYDSCGFLDTEAPASPGDGMGVAVLKAFGMDNKYMIKRL